MNSTGRMFSALALLLSLAGCEDLTAQDFMNAAVRELCYFQRHCTVDDDHDPSKPGS